VVSALSASQAGKPSRCLFFLSGSPWGLHERLSDAFDRALVPQRVTILRSYSREPIDSYQFKRPHLEQLVSALPQRRWLLLGDSGEKDPEVYAQLRRDHPGQIEHIYIHNVTHADPNAPRFAAMTLFQQWSEVERDLQQRGYGPALPPAPMVNPTAK
jgi:phosphatidate phosphatase APP1